MFFTSNIKYLLIFVFFFIVIVLYSKVHKQRQKIIRKAEELYKNNLIKLQEEDLAAAQALIVSHKEEIAEREKAIKAGMKKGARKQ